MIAVGKIHLVAGYTASLVAFRGPLIVALTRAGYFLEAYGPEPLALHDEKFLNALGVVFHRAPVDRAGANPFSDLRYALSLYMVLRKDTPQRLLAYTAKPVIYGILVAWAARVPLRYALITGVGYALMGDRKGLITRAVTGLYRFSLSRATKVFFQNPDDERLFRQQGILAASVPSVIVNGSGVDVASYAFRPIPAQAQVFLMIGRLLGDKGVREFAAAARRIKNSAPYVRFHLVGWIDSNPDSIKQGELDAWIADGTLEFLGKLDDVRPAIADSTVYVLPSYREGTPRTVLEAMAIGRPVITTDAPGCRETVIDGENGFLVPVKSVDALVEAMLKFIDDPTLAPRMGKRSREIAEEKYDVHKVNAVMLREMGIIPGGEENTHA